MIFFIVSAGECTLNACSNMPCKNGGTCIASDSKRYECRCADGFAGNVQLVTSISPLLHNHNIISYQYFSFNNLFWFISCNRELTITHKLWRHLVCVFVSPPKTAVELYKFRYQRSSREWKNRAFFNTTVSSCFTAKE